MKISFGKKYTFKYSVSDYNSHIKNEKAPKSPLNAPLRALRDKYGKNGIYIGEPVTVGTFTKGYAEDYQPDTVTFDVIVGDDALILNSIKNAKSKQQTPAQKKLMIAQAAKGMNETEKRANHGRTIIDMIPFKLGKIEIE